MDLFGYHGGEAFVRNKGGKWVRVRFEPTHWTHWESEPDHAN